MRKRYWLLAIILITTGAAVSALVWLNKRGVAEAQQSGAEPGTLAAMAQQAIAAGQPMVLLMPPTVFHDEELSTLDDIFTRYNLVIADLVSKQVVADPSADYVFTWYKFRLVQNLNPQVTNTCSTCPDPPQPPSNLLSLQPGEFLVVSLHGSATISGVNFLGLDHFNEFQLQYAPAVGYTNRYLMAVRFFTSPPVANLAADKILTYAVSSAGWLETLYVFDSPFRDQFSARYHNNINEVLSGFGVTPTPTPTPTPGGCNPTQQQNCIDQGGTWNSSTCTCQPAFDPCLKKPWLCE